MNAHYRQRGHSDINFSVSPSGDKIAFSAAGYGGRDLYLLDLNTWRVTPLIQGSGYEGDPSFSPDGKTLVYAVGNSGDRADHLFICSVDGKQVRQITNEDYNDQSPIFSPDGSKIAFARNLTYNWGGLGPSWNNEVIFLVNKDGSNLRPANNDKTYHDSIYFVNKANRLIRRLTIKKLDKFQRSRDSFKPHFTPTGKQIFFLVESWPDGGSGTLHYSLWRIDVNGKNALEIADSSLFDDPLHWEPPTKN